MKCIQTPEIEIMRIFLNMLKKWVKLLQVHLFLAGFSHFEPLCAAAATASKKLRCRRRSAARPPLVTNFATTAMIAIVYCECTAFRLGDYVVLP